MGGRLLPDNDRTPTQTFGDVLHEIAKRDPRVLRGLEKLARWKLQMLKVEPPPLRAKHYLKPR